MNFNKLRTAIAIIVLASCPVFAGTDAAAFLNTGVGARAMAMGSAFVSVSDDATAMYWNPAGLACIDKFSVTTMSRSLGSTQWDSLQDINPQYQFMGLAVPVGYSGHSLLNNSVFAAGMINSGLNNVSYTYLDPSGAIVRDTFQDTENAYLLSWGLPVPGSNNHVFAGATLTYISQNFSKIQGASATGYDADFGLLYRLRNMSIGMVVERGAEMKWANGADDSSGITTKLGVSNNFDLGRHLSLLGSLDFVQTKDEPMIANGGCELGYEKKIGSENSILFEGIYLRLGVQGYAIENRNNSASAINDNLNYTAGLGLDFSVWKASLQLDYAMASYSLGDNNLISLSLSFQ